MNSHRWRCVYDFSALHNKNSAVKPSPIEWLQQAPGVSRAAGNLEVSGGEALGFVHSQIDCWHAVSCAPTTRQSATPCHTADMWQQWARALIFQREQQPPVSRIRRRTGRRGRPRRRGPCRRRWRSACRTAATAPGTPAAPCSPGGTRLRRLHSKAISLWLKRRLLWCDCRARQTGCPM